MQSIVYSGRHVDCDVITDIMNVITVRYTPPVGQTTAVDLGCFFISAVLISYFCEG